MFLLLFTLLTLNALASIHTHTHTKNRALYVLKHFLCSTSGIDDEGKFVPKKKRKRTIRQCILLYVRHFSTLTYLLSHCRLKRDHVQVIHLIWCSIWAHVFRRPSRSFWTADQYTSKLDGKGIKNERERERTRKILNL